jgi:hypothetical protein
LCRVAVKVVSNEANICGDSVMNKILGLAFVVYLLGDPSLSMLEGLSISTDYVVALVAALITIPWVTSQFDN